MFVDAVLLDVSASGRANTVDIHYSDFLLMDTLLLVALISRHLLFYETRKPQRLSETFSTKLIHLVNLGCRTLTLKAPSRKRPCPSVGGPTAVGYSALLAIECADAGSIAVEANNYLHVPLG